MNAGQRGRGRPPGSAVKPYLRRIPKVVGLSEEQDDDLSPQERAHIRDYAVEFDKERLRLQSLARSGDFPAKLTLWTRFHLTVTSSISTIMSYSNGRIFHTVSP